MCVLMIFFLQVLFNLLVLHQMSSIIPCFWSSGLKFRKVYFDNRLLGHLVQVKVLVSTAFCNILRCDVVVARSIHVIGILVVLRP